MKHFIVVAIFLTSYCVTAQTGSEIYLADLKINKKGVSISNQKNITNRKGYDNQPYFDPQKPQIYFSSFNDSGRAEIKIYNFKTSDTKQFTNTREREYSPTVTPDKKFISCIIQRDNGEQNLGKYPIGGGEPLVIINKLTVGYHAWLNPSTLLLFVLGDPNTLRTYDVLSGKDIIVQEKIGRSLHRIPGQNAISYVDKSSEKWLIRKFDGAKTETICETLPNREDLAWTPDGKIIMSDGRQFFYYDTTLNDGWKIFFASDITGVTRIAVSSDGKKIAFVVSE